MDAKIVFWGAALLNMGAIVAFALCGVRAVAHNEIDRHRRYMFCSAALTGAFLVAYLLKVFLLGAEKPELWSQGHRINLWVHETFVAGMLIAGSGAFYLSRRFRGTRRLSGDPQDPLADPTQLQRHRIAGKTAITLAILGFLTACGIFLGMLGRSS